MLFASIFPENDLDMLLKNYGQCFNRVRLKNEPPYVYSSPEFRNKSVYELHQQLHAMGLTEALPEVAKLSTFILTIPATSASAERSFSALRRIQEFTLTKGTAKAWTDYQDFIFSPLGGGGGETFTKN
jgi:hypothetical protein